MRLPLLRPVVLLAALLVLAVLMVAPVPADAAPRLLRCDQQRSSLRLCGARTDNYKDCYNTPDGYVETRTWLNWQQLFARGARYRRAARVPQFSNRIKVIRLRGNRKMPRRGYITVAARTGNVHLLSLRTGPPARLWGPLLQLQDPAALTSRSVQIQLRLHRPDGRIVARTNASYRRDARLAAAEPGSPEHNGPAGRWYVGGARTSTDLELGARHRCS